MRHSIRVYFVNQNFISPSYWGTPSCFTSSLDPLYLLNFFSRFWPLRKHLACYGLVQVYGNMGMHSSILGFSLWCQNVDSYCGTSPKLSAWVFCFWIFEFVVSCSKSLPLGSAQYLLGSYLGSQDCWFPLWNFAQAFSLRSCLKIKIKVSLLWASPSAITHGTIQYHIRLQFMISRMLSPLWNLAQDFGIGLYSKR